jgi:hypothetical protein
MSTIGALIVALVRIFLPALMEAAEPRYEDASPNAELREKLKRKVRSAWGKIAALLPPMLLAVFLSGCSARTVYVPNGTPVRLRETVRNAKVWVLGEDGKPVAGEMDISEGWYALPLGGDE